MARDPLDPARPDFHDDPARQPQRLDNEFRADPELSDGPASGTQITMFVVAAVIVLGAVFYGLNSATTDRDATTAAQSTQTAPATTGQSGNPANPSVTQSTPDPANPTPGLRDVTPRRDNMNPGVTTGTAPPTQEPRAAPGATDGMTKTQ